jgi:hypothetical protein
VKRIRSDSSFIAVKAMEDAAKPNILPPEHAPVREEAFPFWEGIIRARAREEWSEVDLVVASQLAQCQSDIAEEDVALRCEGKVVVNQRGTQIMNPRATVLEQLSRRQLALMRALRMGGQAAGDSRDEAGRRKIEKQSRELREELAEDDLLAV